MGGDRGVGGKEEGGGVARVSRTCAPMDRDKFLDGADGLGSNPICMLEA